jgi:dipeptidyl aminopeptidase/acylaminoacyl peptidase
MIVVWFSALFWGCEKEGLDPDKYVLPVQVIASRNQESILLKWHSYSIAFNKSNNIYRPDAVDGEVFLLFHAADDTLDFRLIENFTRETKSYQFIPDEPAENHYFRMEVYAGRTTPAATKIQVQLGENPFVIKLTEFPYDYNSAIGNFDPENRHMVFSRNYRWKEEGNCCTDYSLFFHDVQTGKSVFVVEEAYNPSWSPDGEQIVFTSGFGMNEFPTPSNLGLYDPESDSVIQLTTGPNEFRRPLWSPDGSRIIFLSDIPDNNTNYYWDVFSYDLSSGEWGPVAGDAALMVLNLPYSLSPDGKRIAFVDNTSKGFYSIMCYDMETQTTHSEIQSGWHDFNPSWSPDGKFLAFLSYRSGKPEIWLMELSTGNLRQVTGEEDHYIDSELVWSRDSRQIFFKLYLDQVFGIYQVTI